MIEPLTQRNTKRFQVALSFAGEHRNFVAGVAEHLSRNLGQNRVFYDRYYEAELARPNLDTYLMDIYREHADLIAIFLCSNYTQKEWCGLEWRVVRDVLKSRRDSEIMPFKFDDVFIEGLLSIDGYIDIDNRTPKEVAYLILQRINGKDTLPLHSSKSTLSAPAARPTVAETVIKAGSAAVKHLPRFLMRTFIVVATVSIVLLVIAEVGLGWSLDAAERSFVVLIVLLITMGGTWIRNRLIGGKDDKT
jgi:TIR domain-containing protein